MSKSVVVSGLCVEHVTVVVCGLDRRSEYKYWWHMPELTTELHKLPPVITPSVQPNHKTNQNEIRCE